MDEFDSLASSIKAMGPHEPDSCTSCTFSGAIRDDARFENKLQIMMGHLMNESPFVGLVAGDVSQAIFDAFCLAVIITRAATINAVERGELEIWAQAEKATDNHQSKVVWQTGK